MQIVNLSPDSFSGWDEELPDFWGDVIDVGAVSTRPNADKVSTSEEIKRLEGFFASSGYSRQKADEVLLGYARENSLGFSKK
jgi:dihydropteroate synthase